MNHMCDSQWQVSFASLVTSISGVIHGCLRDNAAVVLERSVLGAMADSNHSDVEFSRRNKKGHQNC